MNKEMKTNQMVSYVTNSAILVLVLLMMAIYNYIGAKSLVIYSYFVTAFYLLNFFFIYKTWLRLYVWTTYAMLTIYMAVCTVMLGYNYGFNLYSMSTIPLIYYVKYIAKKLGGKDPKPVFWTIAIMLSCTISSIYTVYHGPVYKIGGVPQIVFLGINIVTVCSFLFYFSRRMVILVVESEEKLEIQANFDALTKLSNRYFMRNILLNAVQENNTKAWIAMIDIDKFKVINDNYGHNVGDQILKHLADIMTQVCKDCIVSRWGGEEFLIYGEGDSVSTDIIQQLRKTVEDFSLPINDQLVKFTITAGVSAREDGQTMDKWIISADNKLYSGKASGRNKVVY